MNFFHKPFTHKIKMIRYLLIFTLTTLLIVIGTGCQSTSTQSDSSVQESEPTSDKNELATDENTQVDLSQSPVDLVFFCETHQTEFDANSLQSEKVALFYSLGAINIDEKGQFSIGYGPITAENSVFFPGTAGTIEGLMDITTANWSGTYDSETQTGSGEYYFEYTLTGEEAGADVEVKVYLDGTLTINPSSIETHKGRLEISFTGTMSRDITIGGNTTTVKDEDDSCVYIYTEN